MSAKKVTAKKVAAKKVVGYSGTPLPKKLGIKDADRSTSRQVVVRMTPSTQSAPTRIAAMVHSAAAH